MSEALDERRGRRGIRWGRVLAVLGGLGLVAVVVVVGARWLLSADGTRHALETVLGRAIHRDVAIDTLAVEPTGRVDLGGVTVAQPEGFGTEPLLSADAIGLDVALDDLLDGRIVGNLTATGLVLRAVKLGGHTNLQGMIARKGAGGGGGPPIDLHLDVLLEGSRVILEDRDRGETLELHGVGIRALLSNHDDARDARVSVTVERLELHGVEVRDIEVELRADEQAVEITRLSGAVADTGKLSGSGRAGLGPDAPWSFDLQAEAVPLREPVLPVIVALFPPVETAVGDATKIGGTVSARATLAGRGLTWETIAPTLHGQGTLELERVVLPKDALASRIVALAGGAEEGVTLDRGSTTFSVDDGWIELAKVEARHRSVAIPVSGRVSLGGELDLKVDLLPLVKLFGGGAYASASRWASSIPVRVGGTVREPKIQRPNAGDLGKSLMGGLIRRGLE